MSGTRTRGPTPWLRLRVRARRLFPLLVWAACVVAVLWLAHHHLRPLRAHGYAWAPPYTVDAPATAPLRRLLVRLHEDVAAGQPVAGLDGEPLRLRVAAAQAELERLRAELERRRELARADARTEATRRENALRRFARDVENARLDVLRLTARLEEDRIRRHGVSLELARQQRLFDGGFASGSRLDELRTEHDALARRIRENEAVLGDLRERHRRADERLEALRARAGADPVLETLVAPLRWSIEAQAAALEEIGLERARLTLRAPVAGRVERILARPGQVVVAGEPVLEIQGPAPTEILAWVDEARHDEVRAGQAAVATRLATGERLRTRVVRTARRIEALPARLLEDRRMARYGLLVHLAIPAGATLTAGERLAIELAAP